MTASDWQDQLVALYCVVCEEYSSHLWTHVQRQSNNARPAFSDEEVLTVYLFGLLRRCPSVKDGYRLSADLLGAWFPRLPSYEAFSHRLGALSPALPALVEALLGRLPAPCASTTHLLDSMPVLLAKGVRAHAARVAAEMADMGYCASKQTYYYGVKLHALGLHTPHALPRLEQAWVSRASQSDIAEAKQRTAELPAGELYADKADQDRTWEAELAEHQQLALRTPVRRVRGGPPLDAADRLLGTAVSRVRQPIESFFAWLDRLTRIEDASRVRSTAGLWVHLFGRLAAALLMILFNS